MSATPDAPAAARDEAPAAGSGFRGWPRGGRWAAYVAVGVVLLIVAGLVAAAVVVRRPLPAVDGELEVAGLRAPVQVLRDDHGIPHVYADTAEDLFFAQGFVHAQDRFFEMDFRRHVTAGRLSELLGPDALETDKFIRTMGWRRIAEKELSLLRADTLDYLEAYSAGVNAYLEENTAGELALEYSVLALNGLDYTPEAWTPADSVAWLKAMAWDLRGNMEQEIQRAIMSVDHSAEEIADLYPGYPYRRHRPIVNQGAVVDRVFEQDATSGDSRLPTRPAVTPEVAAALARLQEGLRAVPDLMGKGDGVGSNSWVVSGERSTTGEPILANDPHLGVGLPGIWHQMGLHCTEVSEACPFDVSGFTFSGLPGVVIGHNQQIAWGFTNLGPDVVDLYLERVDGGSYEYDGERRPLELREETIEILGEEPFTLHVRSTHHGPLLSDVSRELSTVGANAPVSESAPDRGNGYAVALSWTALRPTRTADAIFLLDRATDWEEFREAAEAFAAPSQNMVYADREGHIGYQAPGLIPIRKSGHDGTYPVEGWDPANDWTGNFVPFDAMPSVLDPDDGFVVTANQPVVGRDFPYHLGTDGGAYGYRSQRIHDLLDRQAQLDVDDMLRIQLDNQNGFAPTFVPYLLDVLMPSQYLAAGQRLLQRWDYRQDADSAAAAYYNAVWRRTLELTFHDQLQESVWPDGGDRWWEVMRRLLADPTSHWWDDVETEAVVETRDEVLAEAMAQARDDLVRLQARNPAEWSWGHLHRLNLENQSVGQSDVGLVRWLFNRGGYQLSGGSSTVNAAGWTAYNGFEVDWAPSMRMVVSMADLDASRWINLTGVSGHPFSSHYVDQTELYVEGEALPWRFSRARVEEAVEDTLTLLPAGAG